MDNLNESTTEESSKHDVFLLLLAVFISILNTYLSSIINFVCNTTNKLSTPNSLCDLKVQLANLQKECALVDMSDEFAKYARMQRKIIKIQDELKKEASFRANTNMKHKIVLRIIVGLFGIVIMYLFNAQPVVYMPPHWLYPLSSVLCWPGSQPGTISFLVWCAMTNSVVRTFS